MPLDRRITVSYTTSTRLQDGSADVVTTELQVWATKLQDNVNRQLFAGGSYGTEARVYRIRYLPILITKIDRGETVRVTDPDAGIRAQIVSSVGESDPDTSRRRFMDLLIGEG